METNYHVGRDFKNTHNAKQIYSTTTQSKVYATAGLD